MAKRLTKVSLVLESIADLKGVKAFNAEMRRIEQAKKKLGPALDSVKRVMGGVAIAGGIAAGALATASKAALAYGSEIQHAAWQTGASTDAIQALGHIARNNGSNIQEMTRAMFHMTRTSQDAANGSAEAAEKFARLGIDAKAFARLRPEQQMERLARAIRDTGSDQEALGAAMDILGTRNAPRLMEALRILGREGYASVAESAQRAGTMMSARMVADMELAETRIEQFKVRLTIMAGEIAQTFVDIERGFTGLHGAARALASAEQRHGATSRAATAARLEYIDALLKEGKVRQAMIEMDRVPTSFESSNRTGRARLNENRQIQELASRRREMVAAIASAQAEAEARAHAKADAAKADEEERASVAAQAAADAAAAEERKRLAELAKEYERYANSKIRAEERAADEAFRIATDNAEELRSVIERASTWGTNEFQKRGLALNGFTGDVGAAFNMPTAPTAPRTETPVVTFTIPKDLSVEGIAELQRIMESIDGRLARQSTPNSFGD